MSGNFIFIGLLVAFLILCMVAAGVAIRHEENNPDSRSNVNRAKCENEGGVYESLNAGPTCFAKDAILWRIR